MTDNQPIPSTPQANENAAEQTNDPQSAQLPTTGPKVQVPPSHTSYKIACDKKRDGWDRAKMAAEFVGILFLIIYTLYTAGIYSANQRAAQTAHDTLTQIQQQTTLMQQQLEGTMAAVIDANANIAERGEGLFAGPNVQITMMNTGQLIAHNIHVVANIEHATIPDMRQIGARIPFEFYVPELAPRKDRANEYHKLFNISPKELDLLLDTKRTIRLEMDLTYDSGFSKQARHYCYAFIGARTPVKHELLEHTVIRCEDMPEVLTSIQWNKMHAYANR